jgi:hypothetical protein
MFILAKTSTYSMTISKQGCPHKFPIVTILQILFILNNVNLLRT